MDKLTIRRVGGVLVAVCLCAFWAAASGQGHKTIIGPSNIDIAAGAQLLLAGDAEKGLERTLKGLAYANSVRERVAGNSNACAGLNMLERPEEALPYCDAALEIRERHWRALTNRALTYLKLGRFEESEIDLQLAEELAPGARSVKLVRSMLLDATDPVAPHVIVDDRRQDADSDDE